MSVELSRILHVQPSPTKRRITVAGGNYAVVVGDFRGVSVTVILVDTEL